MSTILNALRRLEDERRARERERDLRTSVARGPAPASEARRRWRPGAGVWLAAVAVLGLASGLGWRAWTAAPTALPGPAEASGIAAGPPPAGAAPPAPAEAHADPPARVPSPASAPARSAPRASPAPSAAAPPPASAPAPAAVPAPDPPSPAPPASEPAVHAPETGPAQVVELRRAGEGLRVLRTVWHPRSERRRAVVELAPGGPSLEMREGERRDGFELVEIRPAGATFVHRGRELERRVGEP